MATITRDVVIVGGGIGGSVLAANLARAGLTVTVLEQLTEFADRVRGEWMAPWGVVEAQALGVYDPFIAAGGHHITRNIGYDELLSPEEAEAHAMNLSAFVPGVPGPLCLEHVVLQNTAMSEAIAAGATVLRGVSRVTIHTGDQPSVNFEHNKTGQDIKCRWLVGADGRTSTVRRQLGLTIKEDPLDHLIVGLLVDGAQAWPEEQQSVGKVGDIHYLIFPQGGGKVRIYADYAYHGKARFNGDNGAHELLTAFNMCEVPNSAAIANARPIGPCRSFPSQDAWVDHPVAPGVVLLGDAAGYNDPILGQGLSVTLRDVRDVRDALLGNTNWTEQSFEGYVEQRRERLRRLRFTAAVDTALNARFEPEDLERRKRAMQRLATDPSLGMVLMTAYVGPERLPATLYTEAAWQALFA
jgi:menaquinone-9 beta-reductase